MPRTHSRLHTVLSIGLLIAWSGPALASDTFQTNVAPILQHRCLGCHNDKERKGEFSLQSKEAALADGHIEAGDSAGSHLLELITPVNGKAEMPKNADPLSAEEIATIGAWIDAGAKWPSSYEIEEPKVTDFDWWSYLPVRRPAVPKVQSDWVQSSIDAFILRKLQQKGLTHSPAADRRTLIRRLTYDLIGLPPSPDEVEAFLHDARSDAYQQLVDRLLESEHYGERWARHWLDVVKYADTCGYDKDKLRPNAWPYRDYVIRSFNEDKPYSQFVQEQIAGDVLFPGTPDGILGLGFIATGPWDFIGHVEVPETKIDGKVARNMDRDDMLSNTLNTFCSVTVQCARCHNHKFDPITQEHYYGMQAIFAAVDKAERPYDLNPKVEQKRRELDDELKLAKDELRELNEEIETEAGPRLKELDKLIQDLNAKSKTVQPSQFGYHSQMASSPDTEKWVEVELGKSFDIATIVLHASHDDFAGIGAGFGFPVRFRIDVAVGATAARSTADNATATAGNSRDENNAWQTVFDQTKSDVANPGLIPLRIDGISQSARRIRITATKLAERKNDYIFALGELEVLDSNGDNVALHGKVTADDSIEAPTRWARANLTDGKWAQADDPKLANQLAAATKERVELLAKVEKPERTRRQEARRATIKKAEQELADLPEGEMVYAAATHFKPQGGFKPTKGKLRPIHVLHRGNIQQPLEAVAPGLLPTDDSDNWQLDSDTTESQRRAALAKWLTADEHPMTWRSIVNRIWQYHFGQGLVSTPNDFGRMGASPTHPELLDWLAAEFRDGGQSFKHLHRLIVMSSVYRQASDDEASNAVIDGGNQYWWRSNRRRLTAEEIRDSILAVSGSLNPAMGGPGFYLFKLEKTDHSPHYEYHLFNPTDEASHRRSVYRFIVRSQPDPWMTTLDCADSSQSTPRRNETLTSLQALSLMNNRFNLVMAERFAEHLGNGESDLTSQVNTAIALIAQREPSSSEQTELVAYARVHGLANMCRLLFNLSEFVFVD